MPPRARKKNSRKTKGGLSASRSKNGPAASNGTVPASPRRNLEKLLKARAAALKRANAALRESDARMRAFLENSATVAWMKDAEGRVVYLSHNFERRFGVRFEDCRGKTDFELWPRDMAEHFRRVDSLVLEENRVHEVVEEVPNPDGSGSWWLTRKFPFVDLSGKRYVGGLSVDITERIQAQEAVRESERRFRQVTESLPQLVWTCDADGLCDYLSPQWVHYTGKPAAEQLGYGWLEQLHPEDRERTVSTWQATAARGDRFSIEFRIRRHDGAYRWFHTLAVPLRDATGAVAKWFGSNTDIQDMKEAEAALRESEARFRQIFEYAATGIAITDMEGRFQQCNPAYCTLLGYSAEDLRRIQFATLVYPEDRTAIMVEIQRLKNQELPFFEIENRYTRKDGRPVWVRKFVSVLPDALGKATHLIALVTDITERMKAKQQLEASEAFTRAILDSLDAHICVLNKEGDIVRTNEAWENFSRREAPPQGAVHASAGANYLDQCRRAISTGDSTAQSAHDGLKAVLTGRRQSFVTEYPCHSPEEKRWFMMRVTPLQGASGAVVSHVNITEQVEMRQVLKEQAVILRDNRDQLEFLSAKLIEAQEEERRRIARELHDDFSQRVASLILDIGTLEQLPPVRGFVSLALEPVRLQLEQLADDIHNLAYKLHPSLLHHAGLQPAIEDHIHRMTQRTGLRIVLKAKGVPETISLDRSTCLFRVLQESLQNIVKHANATDVLVKLSGTPKGIGLSVTDNGKGFAPPETSGHHKGLGLISMQERLRSVNGILRVHSRPAVGTKVCAWIPAQGEQP